MEVKLSRQEKRLLLQKVANKEEKEKVLTAFQLGVEYALIGTLPIQKVPALLKSK
jgi:hypothetical protein